MAAVYHWKEFDHFMRGFLENYVEKGFDMAGYIPGPVHRVSGGVRIVGGAVEAVAAVALAVLLHTSGSLTGNRELRSEGIKVLDYAIHGVANMVRGYVEVHAWVHLLCILYDNYVPENSRLSYSRPIFKGGSCKL